MRIRNRIKQMVDVERYYFSHKGAVSFLTGISIALLSFNVIFNAFYCYGVNENNRNLMFFRRSVYLLAIYILLLILYSLLIRYIGFHFSLVMGFTALSYAADAVSGYLLTRAAYSWLLNAVIDNPIGFEYYSEKALSTVTSNIVYILLAYLVISVIPAFRKRSFLLGRFWIINLLSPLLILLPVILVIILVPEERKVDYASKSIIHYLTLMAWYSIRFMLKALFYLLLFPSRRRMRLEQISSKRFMLLVNRKPGFLKKHIPLLTVYGLPAVRESEDDTAGNHTAHSLSLPFTFEYLPDEGENAGSDETAAATESTGNQL